MTREEFCLTHRMLAEMIETHDDIPMPFWCSDGHVKWAMLGNTPEQQKAKARAIMSALGGKWNKRVTDFYLFLEQHNTFTKFEIELYRNYVCKRRVVGTEEKVIEHPALPAVEAQPARIEVVKREIVEWDCGSLLAPSDVPTE